MVQSSDKRSDTSRTLFKIILMLGLALAGVAAIAAEPPQTEAESTTRAAVPSETAIVKPVETKPVDATVVATRPTRQTGTSPSGARF